MEPMGFEIAKLVVQAATPIVVGILGWKLSKRLKDIEQGQWANRKITEKRIQIYDEVSPLLNKLLCYYTWVGDWQRHTPQQIIDTKRSLDQKIYVNKYLLEPDVFDRYQEFMEELFDHYSGIGEDAKLRTSYLDRRTSTAYKWDDEWKHSFVPNDIANENTVRKLYEAVMLAQRNGINA
ncbi:hypothetical protein IHQ71_06185 [Rhizobium sp. TH2]|uniref:hypothetical protein n=1 Tax=Rhizobium sp. TH2 TaxID=2775403 RepID=UPI0021584416|nr:hypothetical protein [Rhizobium sp. TH2]UVC10192.1 hypothetical protein IHQ71_06185 [Rhizobium sp. TH2]